MADPQKRAALYVDGFNLYHSINDLNQPFLKWLSLWRLGEIIIPAQSERLVKVVVCTAFYPGSSQKRWRHEQFLNALRATKVECIMGHYVNEDANCRGCGDTWKKPTEKESDINLALSLINDGWLDLYDKAYLLSGDSDQAATAKSFRAQFKKKELVTVSTPGRNFSTHIIPYVDHKIQLNVDHLEKAIFPQIVINPDGLSGRRPKEYDPPNGWVHPDNRPK